MAFTPETCPQCGFMLPIDVLKKDAEEREKRKRDGITKTGMIGVTLDPMGASALVELFEQLRVFEQNLREAGEVHHANEMRALIQRWSSDLR